MHSFSELALIEPLQRAIAAQGYTTPTPIQVQAIPPLLAGRDVLGCAQTGTGKTAAFALPVLQHLHGDPPVRGQRPIRALVLSPTRELAAQIGASFEAYGSFLPLRHTVIFGGVGQGPQVSALRRGIDILVATPGRLLDLLDQGHVDLSQVDFFILDEADRMLDMGFIHDIRRVLRLLPEERQNLLFSATMPEPIVELARRFMQDPVQVSVNPKAPTVEKIEQQLMFVSRSDKRHLLVDLLGRLAVERAIVFTRTKHGANRLVRHLEDAGHKAAAMHGNKSQSARERALAGFKSGEIPVLVATDVAARGIDIDGISHVFNFDLPEVSESYVHRIGRTARAGETGVAIAFCDETEAEQLHGILKLTGDRINVVEEQPYHFPEAMPGRNEPQHRAGIPSGSPRRPSSQGRYAQTARRGGRRR